MTSAWLTALAYAAALGCGLMAGVCFAFSSFVMPALSRLPPDGAVAAMQSINRAAPRSLFIAAFLGTAAVCAVLSAAALLDRRAPGAGYLVAGGVLYLAGTFGVTIAFNVPRNEALAALHPAAVDADAWTHYAAGWTAWNHVRTIASLAASAAFMAAA